MMNPYPVYGVAAGATAVSWLPVFDTILHIVASLAIIVTVVLTYIRSRKK